MTVFPVDAVMPSCMLITERQNALFSTSRINYSKHCMSPRTSRVCISLLTHSFRYVNFSILLLFFIIIY